MKSKKSPEIPQKSTESKQSRPGVPGLLTDTLPAGIAFGVKYKRQSPYDALLLSLAAAGEGHYLRFPSLQARSAVQSRARTLRFRVQFAFEGQTLWVALNPNQKPLPGRTMDHTPEAERIARAITTKYVLIERDADPVPANQALAEKRPTLPELALKAIEAKRTTAGEIISWMRSRGHVNGLDLTGTEDLLRNLAKAGKIKLKPLGRGGDPDQPDRWMVA